MRRGLAVVLALGGCLAGAARGAEDEAASQAADDQAAVKAAGVAVDGPGLLEFFRKRTLGAKERDKIAGLIARLRSDEFDEREKSSEALVAAGPVARPQLLEAARDSDTEVRKRARDCLAAIGKNSAADVLGAAVRLVGHLKPAGATEVLLNYLPNVEDAEVADEVCRALATVGVRAGKAEPALVKALADSSATKRAAAGEALARAGGRDHRGAVHKLLKDDSALVRRRVALGLLEARDREALPVLVALMGEVTGEERAAVEARLTLVAGDKAPESAGGADAESRGKDRRAWEKWWKEHGRGIDLARVEFTPRLRGYTLVVALDLAMRRRKGRTARVYETDAAGKTRWEINGLNWPLSAQVLRGDRVLLAEFYTRRVTERTFKGEVKWEKSLGSNPIGARRLANGHTFVFSNSQLLEYDRDGKVVLSLSRPGDVAAADRARDGQIGLLTHTGRFVRLDRSGKELQSFDAGGARGAFGMCLQLLPGGRVLVPQFGHARVVEYDKGGTMRWQAKAMQPTSARRLANGHTLVAGRNGRIVELDRAGREVRAMTQGPFVLFADRR
jgi:hypothetical protein